MTAERLLFVMNAHEYTARHRLPLLAGAVQKGYRVEAVAPTGSPAQVRLEAAGYAVHEIELTRRGVRVWEEVAAIRALTRLYRRLQPALVHHATIKPVLYGSLAARRARVPAVVNSITGLGYVYSGSGWRPRLLRTVVNPLYRFTLRHSNMRVIFQNRDDWQGLADIGAVRDDSAVLIPGSGVDTAHFAPAPEPPGMPTVVFVGRMLRDKGVREFVEAAKIVHSRGAEVRFLLVGGLDPGNPTAMPKRTLLQWVRDGAVEWRGEQVDMLAVYHGSSLVILPSYREGLPKVLLEAAASGRAVITTNAPGCRDAVVDGETGYLVPPRDSKILAERILDLLKYPERRLAMAQAGRERAIKEFSTDRVVADTLAVYEELLGNRPDQ